MPKVIYIDNARFVTVNFSSFFFNIEQEKKLTGSLQIQWVSLGELKVFLSAIFTSNHSRMLLATKHFSSIHLPLPCVVGFLCCCFCFVCFPHHHLELHLFYSYGIPSFHRDKENVAAASEKR